MMYAANHATDGICSERLVEIFFQERHSILGENDKVDVCIISLSAQTSQYSKRMDRTWPS